MDMRPYSSFLLRCWGLNGTGERVEIEHIQTHNSMSSHSITDAIEWIRAVHQGTKPDQRQADQRQPNTTHQEPNNHPIQGEVT